MNRFEKFLGKEKEIQVEGLTFVIRPLKVKDFSLISEFQEKSTQTEATKKILERIFRDSFENLSAEELSSIEQLSISKVTPLIEAFAEVNGFSETTKAKLLERIKQKET